MIDLANEIGEFDPPITKESCKQWDVFKDPRVKPFADKVWDVINNKPGFIAGLKPYPESILGIHRIGMFAEVFVCTSSVDAPYYHKERIAQLRTDVGFDRKHIVFTHSKYIVGGDFLIDDRPDNCFAWAEEHPNGLVFLYANQMNQHDPRSDPRVIRTSNWREIEDVIRRKIR
jgi:5'(3')-deoxyribonucleotidase